MTDEREIAGRRVPTRCGPAFLQEGWVIANHILVSFHVAFISSVLALPAASLLKAEVLRFIFVSPETLVSAVFAYLSFHVGIAIHELGHFRAAARLNALNDEVMVAVKSRLAGSTWHRVWFYVRQFLRAPYGRAIGIKREGLNYYPDAPYNLAVAAAGPRASRNLALAALPPALLLLAVGLVLESMTALYVGRLLAGLGAVGLLDFLLADPGKYAEFRNRERRAEELAAAVTGVEGWAGRAAEARRRMLGARMQEVAHPRFGAVTAPWQFRNCGMGGRHTEKEYPESNISMQEAMFLILGARDYQEAQEMTVRLQTRLKEIIEGEEGCRVMGIGLEGGLAPFIEKADFPLPELRLWSLMKRTIEECGLRPGTDVAIALDPALTELEIAYRDEFNIPDAVGTYLFWRDKSQTVLDRDGVLDLYLRAINDYDIPILSIEDGFSEHDFEGWRKLLDALGDRILVIGDDLVTTNDATIEDAASRGLINAALIKANQIGTLYETLLAMLVALGKGQHLVVSHRSKSPNDDMEAHIALAVNALGLKAGGGSNTERLIKYQAVAERLAAAASAEAAHGLEEGREAVIHRLSGYEEPTNAGIPTVGVAADILLPDVGVLLSFRGATPLGTSAGSGEAIHLVDGAIERAEHREVIDRHAALFRELEPGVVAFRAEVRESQIHQAGDETLEALWARATRYGGKGCQTAAENVFEIVAPAFKGRNAATLTCREIDLGLLALELRTALRRGKLAADASADERLRIMQRKQNLGMNAILSVSLALARGVARLRGQELFELLREEMLRIIAALADENGVAIAGSSLEDYYTALREANARIEAEGRTLHQALRRLTGVYAADGEAQSRRAQPLPAGSAATAAASGASTPPSRASDAPSLLTAGDRTHLEALEAALLRAFVAPGGEADRIQAFRTYAATKAVLAARAGRFGLVNNRLYRDGEQLIVPYLVGDGVLVRRIGEAAEAVESCARFRDGALLTDACVAALIGGVGEVIDLERDLFAFRAPPGHVVRMARLRDLAAALQQVNESTNRNEAVFTLRCLIARLADLSFRTFLGAKNMQPEVRSVIRELGRFLDGPLAARMPLLVRVLVRQVGGLAAKPALIDRLWQDTIDLAEVHVRGSDLVNELRRSTHHALGPATLTLARAYEAWLEQGDETAIAAADWPPLAPADREARNRETPTTIVRRIVADLESLLGATDLAARLRAWPDGFREVLMRCPSGRQMEDEVQDAIRKGVQERNRWVFLHHIRSLRQKADEMHTFVPGAEAAAAGLDTLLAARPDDDGFDADAAERTLRALVATFERDIAQACAAALHAGIDEVLAHAGATDDVATLECIHRLRRRVAGLREQVGGGEQRHHLLVLDGWLEELGHRSLGRLATGGEAEGVSLPACLRMIRTGVENLALDGLHSRELRDLANLLGDPTCTRGEILDLLRALRRTYHKILERVTGPFEKMRERLELSEDELRAVLGHLQRTLFDLNGMVALVERALADLREGAEPPVHATASLHEHEVLHISDREAVRMLAATDAAGSNLRGCCGGKGAGLLYLSHLGLPGRDGFILPATLARDGVTEREPERIAELTGRNLARLEADAERTSGVARRFGDPGAPLLLAVRSSSVFSLPGLLTTVVFVGMNDPVAARLAERDPWQAWDAYRRFLAAYARAVWGLDLERFDLVEATKRRYGVRAKDDLPAEGMQEVVAATKEAIRRQGRGDALEQALADPAAQLNAAVAAVYASWGGEVPRRYREIKGIAETWRTAVIVQEMAFGNCSGPPVRAGMDETAASLTGVVAHTRVGDDGIRALVGECKFSAAGDDLVAGVTASGSFRPLSELGELMPMLTRRLHHVVARLRRFHGTDQEVEFTVQRGVLSVLQTRTAENNVDEVVSAFAGPGESAARGIGIRGGAFRGLVAFSEEAFAALGEVATGRDDVDGVLVVMENPTPDDIPFILSADGLLTARGGSSSHAAVAVNGLESRCVHTVMSAAGLRVDARAREAVIRDADGNAIHRIRSGDVISLDGATGAVFIGTRPLRHRVPEAARVTGG